MKSVRAVKPEKENKDANSFKDQAKHDIAKVKSPVQTQTQNSDSTPQIKQGDDKIKVYLRVRPILKDEEPFDFSLNEKTITIPPQKTTNSSFFCDTKTFTFRDVLNASSKQTQVYEKVAEPLISDFLNGNDVLIFCYGNTNAGKTYTVMGTDKNPGILHRILKRVVPDLLSQPENEGTKLFATFNEIYNERIIDLLSDEKQKDSLSIGISACGDTEIKGCVELPINSLKDVQNAINMGIEGRHRGSTEFNSDSSRSHTVFRLKYVNNKGYSWLSVVDLAGSERVSIINSAEGSFREACNINKSMLVLGKCIRSLREQSTHGAPKIPIPYRESKLTHIFKNLFEPTKRQARAAMIINISPSVLQINDTLFALQFAAKASECSIRQIANPMDYNLSPGSQDFRSNVILEEFIDPDSPEMIERMTRVQVQKEMEEYLIQRQMQYEHQLQLMNQRYQALTLFKGENVDEFKSKPSNSEVDDLKQILLQIDQMNETMSNEISALETQNDEAAKERDSLSNDSIELQNEIESLKTTLGALSNFSSPSKTLGDNPQMNEINLPTSLEELYKLPEQITVP